MEDALLASKNAWPLTAGAPPAGVKREPKQRSYRPWTLAETAALSELVALYGANTKHWGTIARHLPGRSSKQCRDRWLNFAADGINNDKWTTEEDLRVAAHHAQHGPAWAQLSKLLNGRTQLAIKNRWHSTLRARVPQSSRIVLQAYINALKAGKPPRDAYAECFKIATGSDEPDLDLGPLVHVKAEDHLDNQDLTHARGGRCPSPQASEATDPEHSPASADGTESTYHHEATSRTASPAPTEADSAYPPHRRPHSPHPTPPTFNTLGSPPMLSPSPPLCAQPAPDVTQMPSLGSLDASCSSHFSTHPPTQPPIQPHRSAMPPAPPAAGPTPSSPLLHADAHASDCKRIRLTCDPSAPGAAPYLPHPPSAHSATALPLPSRFSSVRQPLPPLPTSSQLRFLPYASTPSLAHQRPVATRQQPLTLGHARMPTPPPQDAPLLVPPGDPRSNALIQEMAALYSQAATPSRDPFFTLHHAPAAALAELDALAPSTAAWPDSLLPARNPAGAPTALPRTPLDPHTPPHLTILSLRNTPDPTSTLSPAILASASNNPFLPSAGPSTRPQLCGPQPTQPHPIPPHPATPSHATIRSTVTLCPPEAERRQQAARCHRNLAASLFGQRPATLSHTLAAAAAAAEPATMGLDLSVPLHPVLRAAPSGHTDPLLPPGYSSGGDLLQLLACTASGHLGDLQAVLSADLESLSDAEMQELLLMTL